MAGFEPYRREDEEQSELVDDQLQVDRRRAVSIHSATVLSRNMQHY